MRIRGLVRSHFICKYYNFYYVIHYKHHKNIYIKEKDVHSCSQSSINMRIYTTYNYFVLGIHGKF